MHIHASDAELFQHLHQEGMLLLANVWDAGSARLVESLGARALATTSGGVAWSHGYADGNALPVPLLLATVAAITRVVQVPLSVDAEAGYSDTPATVGQTVAALLDAGAVGINLEDGDGSVDLLCAKIEQARSAGVRCGVDLFINARTDVYLRELVAAPRRVEETLSRAARYRQAGADGLFVPGLADPQDIAAVVAGSAMPLNLMAVPGLPPAAELAALGVRRLSAGTHLAQAMFGQSRALAGAFLGDGATGTGHEAMSYAAINALFARS